MFDRLTMSGPRAHREQPQGVIILPRLGRIGKWRRDPRLGERFLDGEDIHQLPLAGILPLTAAVNDDGHLTIAGCDAVELAREFGTPLYVFDEETLRHQCREFRSQFRNRHADSGVSYAAKAYLGRALAALLAEEQMGLEVVSGGELAIARSVDFPPQGIYFHGNNKSEEELREALDYGIGRVVVDNSTSWSC